MTVGWVTITCYQTTIFMHRGFLGEADKFYVYLDGQAVVKTTNFMDAVLSLLSALHVFDPQYPPKIRHTLNMFEDMGHIPNTNSKCVAKLLAKINSA